MRALLLMAAIVAGGCGDESVRRVGDDAVDFEAALAARLAECDLVNPNLPDFLPRFCALSDCDAESAFDVSTCLADLDAMACQYVSLPEDCKGCGFLGVPTSCRELWITAPLL